MVAPFEICAFSKTDEGYAAIVAINDLVWPELPKSGDDWKNHDRLRNPSFLFERLVIKIGGRIIGHATYGDDAWAQASGRYLFSIAVQPDFQGLGVGAATFALITTMLTRRPGGIKLLITTTREDKTRSLWFLVNRGFRQVLREPSSFLDVGRFDGRRTLDAVNKVERAGIRIVSMRELSTFEPNWRRIWYDLEGEIDRDVPGTGGGERLPFETFAGYVDGPLVSTDAYFVAIDLSGQFVGLTGLVFSLGRPEIMQTGLTGVIRSHRRQGIATALKTRAIQFARQSGTSRIYTGNEENNPMFDLNLTLGFEPGPAYLRFQKETAVTEAGWAADDAITKRAFAGDRPS